MATTKTKYRRTSRAVQMPLKGLEQRVHLADQHTLRTDMPQYRAGDTLKVHVRIKEGEKERVQIFEGVVIAMSNKGASKSITVRKVSHGVGVERIFLLTSPKVAKIEVAQTGRVRRAKLYYLRGLSGKAARVEREVETLASVAASQAAKKDTATK